MMTIPEWCPPRTTDTFTALQVIYDALAERYRYLYFKEPGWMPLYRPMHMYDMFWWRRDMAAFMLSMLKYELDFRMMGKFFDPGDEPSADDVIERCRYYGTDVALLQLDTAVRGRLLNDWEWIAQMCAVINNLMVTEQPAWIHPRHSGIDITGAQSGIYLHIHFWENIYRSGGENDGAILNSASGITGSGIKTYASLDGGTAFWERNPNTSQWWSIYIKRHNYDRFLKNYRKGQFVGKWYFRYTDASVRQWAYDKEDWFDVSKYNWREDIPDIVVNCFDDESEVINIPSQYNSNAEEILALPQSWAEESVYEPPYDEIGLDFSGIQQICVDWENITFPEYKYFDREAFNKTHNV